MLTTPSTLDVRPLPRSLRDVARDAGLDLDTFMAALEVALAR